MRLNLCCGENALEGHTNVEHRYHFKETIPDLIFSFDNYQFMNDDSITEGSVEKILAQPGCLSSMPSDQIIPTLQRWFDLLQPNGELELKVFCIYAIATDLIYDRIDMKDFDVMLSEFKSVHCYKEIQEFILSVGFEEIKAEQSPGQYFIIQARKGE
jgi:hypothetical protein